MIDKINGNGAYSLQGEGSRQKKQTDQLYENTPGAKELNKDIKNSSSMEARQKHSVDHKKSDREKNGVILDLSSAAAKKQTAPGERTGSLFETLRELLSPVAASIVRWLKNFWESDRSGNQTHGSTNENETDQPAAETLDFDQMAALPPLETEEYLDTAPGTAGMQAGYEKIPAAILKSGNLKKMEQILTQNGERRLAHNSDLLTYYNRNGKFVSIDESEKNRVLYGDKNVHRL